MREKLYSNLFTSQTEYLRTLLGSRDWRQRPLVFSVPGSGLSARSAVQEGVPFLVVLNAGVYRAMGVVSQACFMPFGNANDQVEQLIERQILPSCPDTPIVAGVFAADDTVSLRERFARLRRMGVAGIINWPPASMNTGAFMDFLRQNGFSEEAEADMLKVARDEGFVTFGFAASRHAVRTFASSGVDGMVLNVGWTLSDVEPLEKKDRVQYAVQQTNLFMDDIRVCCRNNLPMCFFYGGGITTAQDTLQLYKHTDIQGMGAGSAIEFFPVREVMRDICREILNVRRRDDVIPESEREFSSFIGNSSVMQELHHIIKRVAAYPVSVCIEGESGSGKELAATMIHAMSPRCKRPFITVNCGAIPDSLVESEFFGHERGAFTGASERRLGKFELANGGTLFLDEVAELSPKAQVCLLRALQQKEIVRLGGRKNISVDVRIITASNRSLEELVTRGLFREDLFYRLRTTFIRIPPLRSRMEDMEILSRHFLEKIRREFGCRAHKLSRNFLRRLKRHSWPGNVRELQHVLLEAAIMEDGEELAGNSFIPDGRRSELPEIREEVKAPDRTERFREAEEALRRCGGNKTRAAHLLGVSRKTLYTWLK